ncbi:hypothetical protein M1N93_02670, partial [Dehalococcoidia bacterium]|nr:hypothetical protein [Dehalococcoidia bacterium]
MASVLVFSPCTDKKDDTESIPPWSRVIKPTDYLGDKQLLQRLMNTREHVLIELGARVGSEVTYALDLYVRTGKAYEELRQHYTCLKKKMLSDNEIQWFFLSGGYGVVHAFEETVKYQASFSQFPGVLRTDRIWQSCGTLSLICDAIVQKFQPLRIYAFGNRSYTHFIKQADFYPASDITTTVFECRGRPGPTKLSPIIGE